MGDLAVNSPAVVQATLQVKHKEYLTPNYIRVTLTGDAVPEFAETTVGVNNKIFIPPAGVDEIHFPSFNFETREWLHASEDVRPTIRTYTHRGIDIEKKEMIIDFVAHGETGPASAWATNAKPGDKLGVSMRKQATKLFPEANWYLLVADATGIPVLSAILESLPSDAKGLAYIEVPTKADEQQITSASNIQINWIHNPTPGIDSTLPDLVKQTPIPEDHLGSRFAYVAAEYDIVRHVRHYLRKEKKWNMAELAAYAYWTEGLTEDGA